MTSAVGGSPKDGWTAGWLRPCRGLIETQQFRITKCAKTLLLFFCKAVYVKVQQMDMNYETGVNMTNMIQVTIRYYYRFTATR